MYPSALFSKIDSVSYHFDKFKTLRFTPFLRCIISACKHVTRTRIYLWDWMYSYVMQKEIPSKTKKIRKGEMYTNEITHHSPPLSSVMDFRYFSNNPKLFVLFWRTITLSSASRVRNVLYFISFSKMTISRWKRR